MESKIFNMNGILLGKKKFRREKNNNGTECDIFNTFLSPGGNLRVHTKSRLLNRISPKSN